MIKKILDLTKKNFSKEKLIGPAILVSLATVISGALGYFFQIFIGRSLGSEYYGIFSSLMAMTVILSAPFGALVMIISKQVSTSTALGYASHFHRYYSKYITYFIFFSFGVLAISYCSFSFLIDIVPGRDRTIFLLFVLIVLASILVLFNNAILQGHAEFKLFSFLNVLPVVLKIIFAYIFMAYMLSGVLFGILLAGTISLLISGRFIYKNYVSYVSNGEVSENNNRGPLKLNIKSILMILLANIGFILMTQLDIILVSHYFDPVLTSSYAVASVLGKAILYLPSGFAIVLYPKVAANHATKQASGNTLFMVLFFTVSSCLCASLFYWIFSDKIIEIFFGNTFVYAGQILKYYGFAILPLAIVMVMEYFLIAKGRMIFGWIILIMAPLQILLINQIHESINQVLIIIFGSGLVIIISALFVLRREFTQSIMSWRVS